MRKITIKLEDETTKEKVSATTSLEQINDVYDSSGTNCIDVIVHQLNAELNKLINRDFKLSIHNPYEEQFKKLAEMEKLDKEKNKEN